MTRPTARDLVLITKYVSTLATLSWISTCNRPDPDAYRTMANSRVYREPIAVVVAISPWNYPLFLSMSKIIHTLAAGCTVVHKISEVTPLNTLLLAEIASAAGVPAGVYNAIVGTGPNIGQPWSVTPEVDMVRSRDDGGGAARVRTLRGHGQEDQPRTRRQDRQPGSSRRPSRDRCRRRCAAGVFRQRPSVFRVQPAARSSGPARRGRGDRAGGSRSRIGSAIPPTRRPR
jgi:hypothetical protein